MKTRMNSEAGRKVGVRHRLRRLAAGIPAIVALFCFVNLPAASAASPAWEVLAVSAPTNLPPTQSEVQQVTVEGEGGSFTLARKETGTGTPVVGSGRLAITSGSKSATIVEGTFKVGQKITGVSIAAETFVEACAPDCSTAGSVVTLTKAATATNANRKVNLLTKEISGVTGKFFVGDEITASGLTTLAPGTTVTAVSGTNLTISEYPVSAVALAMEITATEITDPIPFDASAADVEAALNGLPALAPEGVVVMGGPGGTAERPYFVNFAGAFPNQAVAPLIADSSSLVGEHAAVHVSTSVPGGPGTGELAVYATNIGGAASSGLVTMELGPLPGGIVTAGAAKGSGWSCPGGAGEATVICTSTSAVDSLVPATPIRIPVEVGPTAAGSSSVPVSVQGGGVAAPSSYALPIQVSAAPAEAGFQASWFRVVDADGNDSTQAGGHPNAVINQFSLNTLRLPSGRIAPVGDLKDVIADLPPGLIGNPLTTDRCPQSLVAEGFVPDSPACNPEENGIGSLYPVISTPGTQGFPFPIFNDVPVFGAAAEFNSRLVSPIQGLIGSVRTEDDFGIRVAAPNAATFQKLFNVTTIFQGFPEATNGKAFFANSTDCSEQARQAPVFRIQASSWQDPNGYSELTEQLPPVTGCDKLSFGPTFGFQPTSTEGSSPVGAVAKLHIDQSGLNDPGKLATPALRRSVVQLPEGFTVNPSQANGLEACSEAQVGYLGQGDLPNPTRFNNSPVTCPDASKLGTVEATTPLLEEPLKGTIYLAEQEKNPFGSLIGLYLVIESKRFGITLKLPGKVDTDPTTGQISATFDYVPQQPVEDLTLNFRGGGPRSEFATPEVCGQYSTKGTWTPWSAPESGPPAQTQDSFRVSSGCASSASARPFAPSFEAGTVNPVAGAYSPLVIKVNRKDGEQELTNLDFSLPPGLSGKLAGVPYCSEAQIAAAATRPGKDELASPSCSGASRIGTVDAAAGVGSEPVHVQGTAYLAGPYKGAPVSAVVITPAVAGPFDLGTVVIRSPLYVNPETTQITAQSDAIPTILKGIPLKIRSVAIQIDRPGFTINPTNCEAMSVYGTMTSSSGQRSAPANRFQVGNCAALGFKPKLKLQLKGGTGRTKLPRLRAELTQPAGQSNISRTQVLLPRSEFLEQAHIGTVCTRVQFNADSCPARSVYGQATAWSPLLGEPLSGPVYLRSNGGERELPDLVANLRGPAYQPIEVDLVGYIDSVNRRIRTTFALVPDAPVSRFVLEMQGGKKGLLVNSENLCKIGKRKRQATVNLVGQNGKRASSTPLVSNDCRKGEGRTKKKGR